VRWLYSICDNCDNELELNYSLQVLDRWLYKHRMAVVPALREFTENYLEKSFKSKIHKLAQCYFQDTRGGNLGSNAISEQENSAFKRDPHGPRPHLGIDRAVIATTAHETRRLDGLRRNGMQSLSQTQQEHETEEDTDDQLAPCNLELDLLKLLTKQKDRQCDKVELSKYLVDLAVTTLSQQYEASTNYMYHNHESLSRKFLVRRVEWAIPITDSIQNSYHAHVPKFDRTRIVTIQNSKCTNFGNIQISAILIFGNSDFRKF
jgi:hypothetical protein